VTLDRIEKLATVFASLIAAATLLWNVHEFREIAIENTKVLDAATKRQDDAAAYQIYAEYLRLALDNASFVFDPVNILAIPPKQGKKYTIFATATVMTSGRLFELSKGDPTWISTIDSMLANHHEFILLNINCKDITKEFRLHLVQTIKGYSCK
jgi:predicted NBD/HSP70 family sugar kinase